MWPVDIPQMDPGAVYGLCISTVANAALKARLTAIRPAVVNEAVLLTFNGYGQTLNAINASNGVGVGAGLVTTEEMGKVYSTRMAARTGPGRIVYDRLKMLPKGDKCPYCNHRNVGTLDHFLPKSEYPALAVTPCNLVPACMECNKKKGDYRPTTPDDVLVHPYFENLTRDTWLTAQVQQQAPAAFIFEVTPPPTWNDVEIRRARNHFGFLNLAELFSDEAATELSNIRHNLQMHFDANGANGVQAELTRQWRSRRAVHLNSWQTAMYAATANNAWFYRGGFAAN